MGGGPTSNRSTLSVKNDDSVIIVSKDIFNAIRPHKLDGAMVCGKVR